MYTCTYVCRRQMRENKVLKIWEISYYTKGIHKEDGNKRECELKMKQRGKIPEPNNFKEDG